MKFLSRTTISAILLAASLGTAQAQTTDQNHHPGGQAGMPMMNMMGRQDGMPGMAMAPFEHVEGRIAFLKTELKITDAQLPQWNAFADVLRSNAKGMQGMHEQMMQGGRPAAWPDRLDRMEHMLSARLDAVKAIKAAAQPLYAALSDEQKKLADQLMSGPMGMM